MREDTELIFRTYHLRATTIMWFRHPRLPGSPRCELHFSRLSQNHNIAYFKFKAAEHREYDSETRSAFRRILPFQQLKKYCLEKYSDTFYRRTAPTLERGWYWTGLGLTQDCFLTRMEFQQNDLYMSDLELPDLELHEETQEIALDWRNLYAHIYLKKNLVSARRAAESITFSFTAKSSEVNNLQAHSGVIPPLLLLYHSIQLRRSSLCTES